MQQLSSESGTGKSDFAAEIKSVLLSFGIHDSYTSVSQAIHSSHVFHGIDLKKIATAFLPLIPELISMGEFLDVSTIYEAAGQDDMPLLKERITQGVDHNGVTDWQLAFHALSLGADAHILDSAIAARTMDDHGDQLSTYKTIRPVTRSIRDALPDYIHRNNLPSMQYLHMEGAINAAVHLRRSRCYDAIIGIMNCGSAVPIYMHVLGNENIGFIETHREWKRGPVWRKRVEAKENMRVLLCEDDAASGGTLKNVSAKIQGDIPGAQVSVLFTGSQIEHSMSIAKEIPSIAHAFTFSDLPNDKVYSNLIRMKNVLEKKVRQGKKKPCSED